MIPALLLLLAPSQPEAPAIATERVAPNQYRLTIEVLGTSSVEQGQALLMPTARKLCGDLPATFTTYSWVGSEQIGGSPRPNSLRLSQNVVCGALPSPVVDSAAAIPSDWQPSALDREKIVAVSDAYFAAKDEGRYAQAYDFLADRLKAMSPFERWQANARSFASRAGRVARRRVVDVSWYANPPETAPGLYAAADFRADFATLELCGYVVWLLRSDGSWRMVREEQNILDHETARGASPDQLARIHGAMGCKD